MGLEDEQRQKSRQLELPTVDRGEAPRHRRSGESRSATQESGHSGNGDAELLELGVAENDEPTIAEAEGLLVALEGRVRAAELKRMLSGEVDHAGAIVSIHPGTGGTDAKDWAQMLLRMYLRWCDRAGLHTEVMSQSDSDLGGYKELVLRVVGSNAYGRLKFESGGHRVQRVPTTEAQGRIHTSACTVAVLPEPDETPELAINPADLRIDTFRASGAGGQHINKTDSAIRITHLPTGLVAECQDDRSQHRNKAKALAVLLARLRDRERSAREAKEAAARKTLVGSGDRSDRIRTYNFPQGRLTDHRINLTLYKLGQVMDGDLGEVMAALQAAQAAEQLAALEEGR